jgi:NitT/TauT family transport system permease protein
MNNNQQKGLSIILVLLLLPIWEAIRIFANISPMLMPPLHQIGESLLHDLIHGELLLNILTSFCYIFLGISIACVFCLLFLVLSHKCPILKESIQLLAAIFHPLPGIALLPIIILWAGIGAKAITLIILHSVFWPMLTNFTNRNSRDSSQLENDCRKLCNP